MSWSAREHSVFVQYAATGSAGTATLGSVAVPHTLETLTRAPVQVSQKARRSVALVSRSDVRELEPGPGESHGSGQRNVALSSAFLHTVFEQYAA